MPNFLQPTEILFRAFSMRLVPSRLEKAIKLQMLLVPLLLVVISMRVDAQCFIFSTDNYTVSYGAFQKDDGFSYPYFKNETLTHYIYYNVSQGWWVFSSNDQSISAYSMSSPGASLPPTDWLLFKNNGLFVQPAQPFAANIQVFDCPVINCETQIVCPPTVQVSTANNTCQAIATWGEPTVTSNCSYLVGSNSWSGISFTLGTTTIVFSATTETSTVTCSFSVVVSDGEAPLALCQNVTKQLGANGVATINAEDIDNNSYDLCNEKVFSLSKTSFDCSNLGPNIVTLTVSEVNGNNSSTCSSVVTITSNTPSIGACPAPTVVPTVAVSGNNATFSWMPGCYNKYRVQYRKTTPSNASWTTKLVNAPASSTMSTIASPGTYRWSLTAGCNGSTQFSSASAGNNFNIGAQQMQANVTNFALATAYPNPSRSTLNENVNPDAPGTCLVRMFDQTGRTTYTTSFFAEGQIEKQWSVENMPNGLYFLQILMAGQDPITKSIVVQN